MAAASDDRYTPHFADGQTTSMDEIGGKGIAGGGCPLGAAFAAMFVVMCQPPQRFGQIMAYFPMPAMSLFPFESMWNVARGGAARVGEMAPDFDLATIDRKTRVRLSSFRGKRPVVLVFGSYT